MNTCVFCKIVSGQIPNHTVYEDSHVLAFLDINPRSEGHTVVVPKVHAETIFDLNDELEKELMVGIKRAMEKLELRLSPDGFNVGWNHGVAGGQEVAHLHIHIFPRWNGDEGKSVHAVVNRPGEKVLEDVAKIVQGR